MNPEQEERVSFGDGKHRWLRKALWVPVWIFLAAAIYLVSPVLLWFLNWLGVPLDPLLESELMNTVYEPLQRLYDNVG